MWLIDYKSSTLQEVLILAYMNVLEARASWKVEAHKTAA